MSDDPLIYFSETTPRRVVSLVPSMTESLFDLGFGESVVGVTDFCTRPQLPANLLRLGGPKTPNQAMIIELAPDLVIANREENSKDGIEGLLAAGLKVWLTFPQTVEAAVTDLWTLTRLFRSDAAGRKVDILMRSLEWAQLVSEDAPRKRVFCPIWQEPLENGQTWWMTFNEQTYPSDLLKLFGADNVFAQRPRRYPLLADLGLASEQPAGERDTRYPRVTLAEILEAQPDLILLPDEPYAYSDQYIELLSTTFADTPAAKQGRIVTIDGSLLMWPGTRLGSALAELSNLI